MIKKTIKYIDFNDQEVEEDFYFNLSKSEIAEMEIGVEGGLSKQLQTIYDTKDMTKVLEAFKQIVRASVGKRSEDGRKFIKNDDIVSDLFDTGAYDEFFFELLSSEKAAVEFVEGIVPRDAIQKANEAALKDQDKPSEETVEELKRRLAAYENK